VTVFPELEKSGVSLAPEREKPVSFSNVSVPEHWAVINDEEKNQPGEFFQNAKQSNDRTLTEYFRPRSAAIYSNLEIF
jgi:hypothetical protein